ncbi:MAG: SRPBCC domain-containing protein [Pseudomonadota bacterium]
MTDQMSGPTTVTVTREIAASPERVFAIWTDPDAMMRWFGIEGMTNLEAGFEPRVGGAWFSKARDPGGAEFRMAGTVTVFEPGRRLGQTWAYVDAEGVRGNETEVEVIFEAAPKGCRVTVNHRRILYTPDAFREGWGQSLDRIERMVA